MKLFALTLLLAFQLAALAQGTVVFSNRNTAVGLDAPIKRSLHLPGTFDGPGPDFVAGLYYQGMLVPGSVTPFRDGSVTPALARYIVPVTVTLPGTEVGQRNVPVQMRVWLASAGSYEAASILHRGSSGDLIVAELGGGPNPDVPNHLPASFTGFFQFPEPSTSILGLLGAGMLLLRRIITKRKNL